MAISFKEKINLSCVEIISENDDALDVENSDLEKYKETLNVNHLKFLPDKEPTIFICNFNLKGKDLASVNNAMIDGTDDEGKPKVAIGSWAYRITKLTLKDIKNPSYLKEDERINFKKDFQGYAHDDVVSLLQRIGIANEILTHYITHTQSITRREIKN